MNKAYDDIEACFRGNKDYHSTSDYRVLFVTTIHKVFYELRECERCGLVYHSPSSGDHKVVQQYEGYGSYSSAGYVSAQLKTAAARNKKLARRFYAELGINKPKLLEVGSSSGILLKHLSESGFDCYGAEVDASASSVAKGLIGEERVFSGLLGDSPFMDGSFDIVVCKQTIEHVLNPLELLSQMAVALKENGMLYIDTPNFGGPSMKLLGEKWKNILPCDHVSMFTASSLENYLNAAGFKVINLRAGGLLFNDRRGAKGGYKACSNPLIIMAFKIAGVVMRCFNFGDSMSVIARRQ